MITLCLLRPPVRVPAAGWHAAPDVRRPPAAGALPRHTGVCEQSTPPEKDILEKIRCQSAKSGGEDSSFRCWIAGQRLA